MISFLGVRYAATLLAAGGLALSAGCASPEPGAVPAAESSLGDSVGSSDPKLAGSSVPAEESADASNGRAQSTAANRFNAGTDRVDSASRVSAERQRVVASAANEYFRAGPELRVVSVQAADEGPRRSAAYAVVNNDGERIELALTVELKKGAWRVTEALSLAVEIGQ